ncbi:hypothetical protein UVI_02007960 [Ustilaginoidea virens]|uniref:Uncharacterized protein n=1 Tax=Ustilaginoidea virens TaxID=1159556 RepID=A0A1B5L972_USTVR|nr:hypothetical protein UVI_02007960 [Ustilaginoidea virens]
MGPPVAAEPGLCVVTKEGDVLSCGEDAGEEVEGDRGRVSNDSALRHDARIRENESGSIGSRVEV